LNRKKYQMSVGQIIFILLSAAVFFFAFKQFGVIYANIKLGKEEDISGDAGERWKNTLLVAFGQKKMFKRWIPALLHLFIYVAFLMTQVELIEIFIDGFFGVHRFFADKLGGLYTVIISFIEILSVLAFIATIIFLWRRNVAKLPRFVMAEMKGWPKLDGNLILIGELFLLVGIFSMNGADVLLQQLDPAHFPNTGNLAVSSHLGPALFGGLDASTLHVIERFGWWLHLIVVFGFITYLPHSKHLHIFLAFPNVYFSKLKSRGEMENMPEIMNEVKSMMGLLEDTGEMNEDIPEFGSKDVMDLGWKNILEAYTCTECGRCSEVCPANITGKKLSPRKIMMDIRDRATEIGENIKSGDAQYIAEDKKSEGAALSKDNYDDGKSLFDYISNEELYACTTCNACVEACPIMINPLEPILAMRRYDILTNSAGPGDWLPMFNSVENSGAVWSVSDDRGAWREED
jgi:heterodisulfide reductase subunit C